MILFFFLLLVYTTFTNCLTVKESSGVSKNMKETLNQDKFQALDDKS